MRISIALRGGKLALIICRIKSSASPSDNDRTVKADIPNKIGGKIN